MLSWTKFALLGIATAAGSGCATSGTRPHDMSAAGHEQTAETAEAEAREHAARFDPSRVTTRKVCSGRGPCWNEEVNPTTEHRAEAAELQRAAAEHRKAAEALRAAEARACAGLTDEDRDLSPFFHRGDVERVEPMYRNVGGRGRFVTGATVVFAQVPGLTAEWMQKSLDCHMARNAAVGFDAPEMSYCPLAAKGVHAVAREAKGRVSVEITSDDKAKAEEVLRRAQLLAPR